MNDVDPEDVGRVVADLVTLSRKNSEMGNPKVASTYADAASHVEAELIGDGNDPAPFIGYCLECGAKHEIGDEFDTVERGCMCGGYVLPDPTDGEGVPA